MTEQNSQSKLIDPTKNVLDLVQGEVRRIDDIAYLRDTNIKEILKIRDEHSKQLNDKESSRLDSIRQVDVLNQAAAAKSALDAIQALASTTTTNADNIRNALNSTASQMAKQTTDLASTIAAQTQATADAMTVRIAALEKSSAEGIGKGRVIDPQLESLIVKVNNIADTQNTKQGSGEGMKNLWSLIIGGVLFLIGVASFIIKF